MPKDNDRELTLEGKMLKLLLEEYLGRLILFMIFMMTLWIIMAWAILHFGGWFVMWGAPSLPGSEDIDNSIAFGHGIAIRFNGLLYGFAFVPRFFDSPVIQWLAVVLAAVGPPIFIADFKFYFLSILAISIPSSKRKNL